MNILMPMFPNFYFPEEYREKILAAVGDDTLVMCDETEVTEEIAAAADVWIGKPSHRKLGWTKNLKWLQCLSAGVEYYCDKPEVLPTGVILTNNSGAFGRIIAEHMTGGLLMLLKEFHIYRDQQSKSLWQPRPFCGSPAGMTALVLGMGDLGSEFAKLAKALGMYTIGVRRTVKEKPDFLDELYPDAELDSLLPRSDVLAMCLPSTPDTRGMLNAKRLNSLKEKAYLINVGRGSAVDTTALTECLASGQLAGAVLDVTSPEPLPEEHPLWKEPNAIITPHISGRLNSPISAGFLVDLVVDNLGRFRRGEPLRNLVDVQAGYRK